MCSQNTGAYFLLRESLFIENMVSFYQKRNQIRLNRIESALKAFIMYFKGVVEYKRGFETDLR